MVDDAGGAEQETNAYRMLDNAVFKAHTVNMLCKYSGVYNGVDDAICVSDLLVDVPYSAYTANGSEFHFSAYRRTAASQVGYQDLLQARQSLISIPNC